MINLFRSLAALAVGLVALSGCGSSVDVGSDCATTTDCGDLRCFCAADPIPGVCSRSCTKDADCTDLGDDMSCAIDFCSGASVCLQGYKRTTL